MKRSITRVEKGGPGGDQKGNDCSYQLSLKNTGVAPLTGLKMESIIFAPAGAPVASAGSSTDVASLAPGKTATVPSAKIFVPQTESVTRSGLSSIKSFAEGSPAGVYTELVMDGKTVAAFTAGTIPTDSAEQLAKWRASRAEVPEKPAEKSTGK